MRPKQPRALPWAKSFCPFRACCLCPFPWAKSFCPFRACGAKLARLLLHSQVSQVVYVRAEGPKALSPGQRKKSSSLLQHALKGQKLLAQGNALGIKAISKSPCKGKSFTNCPWSFKAFALTGRQVCEQANPGRCPWAKSFCPFRACCLRALPLG